MTDQTLMERIVKFRSEPENQSPHALFLGLQIVDIEPQQAVIKIPYSKDMAGNAATGILHGGLVTTALDSASGLAVFAALEEFMTIATLDLRIDYLKPATPAQAIFAWAHCYKTTRNVCFVRGVAYHQDRNDPIANCTATFMVTNQAGVSAQDRIERRNAEGNM